MTSNDEQSSEVVISHGFTAIPNAIIEADISPAAFKVYCAIRSYGRGSEPSAFPKMETVCNRFHIPIRTFTRALKELEDAGMIVTTKRTWAGGMRKANTYTFPIWPMQLANLASRDLTLLASREDTLLASPEEEDLSTKKTTLEEDGKTSGRKRQKISPDFEPSPDSLAWSRSKHPRLNVSRETSRFIGHHLAKGSLFLDWQQAWRNWMDNAADWNPPQMSPAGQLSPPEIDPFGDPRWQ